MFIIELRKIYKNKKYNSDDIISWFWEQYDNTKHSLLFGKYNNEITCSDADIVKIFEDLINKIINDIKKYKDIDLHSKSILIFYIIKNRITNKINLKYIMIHDHPKVYDLVKTKLPSSLLNILFEHTQLTSDNLNKELMNSYLSKDNFNYNNIVLSRRVF